MGQTFKQLKEAGRAMSGHLNDFSLALGRRVPPDAKGNRLLSPWSASGVLHALMLGARGETEKEMREALGAKLPGQAQHGSLRLLNLRILRAGGSPMATLRMASRAWASDRFPLRADYAKLLGDLQGAELGLLDFKGKNAEALKSINGWVSEATSGKIPQLLKTLSTETRLALASAAYFKGQWASRFPSAGTKVEPFKSFGGEVKAPLMRQKGSFRYAEAEGVQALSLPYQGGQFSMLLLLPAPGKEALESFEGRLDAAQLARLRSTLQPAEVSVFLPRFAHRTRVELKDALGALGMKRAFGREADFSGLSNAKEPLWIDQVTHEVFASVDEQGTEAAATTAVGVVGGAAPAAPKELRADRPFLFFILHERTGTVLFSGRVGAPLEER
jgi:serpin B